MHPLKYVSRVPGENGKVIERSRSFDTKMWDKLLVEYLNNLDPVLKQLKPIAQQVAKDNTVVVMVCNLGQSELLMNFACAARLRGLDLSQVLVFATDLETKTLAEGLGLAAFYDELVNCMSRFCKCESRCNTPVTHALFTLALFFCFRTMNPYRNRQHRRMRITPFRK